MIHFSKLHGNGNDFIIIDEYQTRIVPDNLKSDFARQYCDRKFGIGSDGVLFISRSDVAELKMRLFQPDGSQAEMCGNGIRCLVKYALDMDYISFGNTSVETQAGIMLVDATDHKDNVSVKVNMGKPLFNRKDIPAKGEGEFINESLEGMSVSVVNTGVPHAVIFSDDLEMLDINTIAPPIRHHNIFPKGVNVNFVCLRAKGNLDIRTFERGVEAETLSCGTGSVASAVVAHRLGITGSNVVISTLGGVLTISLVDGYAYMEGTAATVFSGTIP
jgi:diaminopimelate epimerase